MRPIHRRRPDVVRGNCDLPSTRTCLIPSFALSQEWPLCSASPPPFTRQYFPPLCGLFDFPPFPVPVLALYFALTRWAQPFHPASPRPSSVSRMNLVLTHRLLSFLPFSAAVRQFWCHGRWYERSDLWFQLAVHHRCHRLCRYDHSTPGPFTVSSLTSTVRIHPRREAAGAKTWHIVPTNESFFTCWARFILILLFIFCEENSQSDLALNYCSIVSEPAL